MAKRSGTTKHDLEAVKLFRLGGTKIPAGLAAKARAATKSMLLERPDPEIGLRMQAAKLYGELKGGSPIAVNDPANRATLDAILRLHRKVASKKLAFPKVTPGPGRANTVFSGTLVPPFDFASAIPIPFAFLLPIVGNPTLSGAASANGQISGSGVTPETQGGAGGEFARVGIYSRPPGPGTLTISANPTYSFEWATNFLN